MDVVRISQDQTGVGRLSDPGQGGRRNVLSGCVGSRRRRDPFAGRNSHGRMGEQIRGTNREFEHMARSLKCAVM